jgi:hypothetical protein
LKSRSGKERVLNVDRVLLPSKVMRTVIESALNLIMTDMKNQIIQDMQSTGIRLDDETAYYSLSQIRDYLHLIFGENGAELVAGVLRNTLERNHVFEKYS